VSNGSPGVVSAVHPVPDAEGDLDDARTGRTRRLLAVPDLDALTDDGPDGPPSEVTDRNASRAPGLHVVATAGSQELREAWRTDVEVQR